MRVSDARPVEEIRQVITDNRFHGEGYRKVWARLCYEGIRTSQARVLRRVRERPVCEALPRASTGSLRP